MALIGYWNFKDAPHQNVVADSAGSLDITHGGGIPAGAGWWRDNPEYAIFGSNISWAFTTTDTNLPDISGLSEISFSWAMKQHSGNPLRHAFRLFGNNPFRGWGITLGNSTFVSSPDGQVNLWDGTGPGWKTFPTNFGSASGSTKYHSCVLNMVSGGNAEFFLDGVSLGTVSIASFTHLPNGANLIWGTNYSYTDNIQYHDRVLTADEIAVHAAVPRAWQEGMVLPEGLGDEAMWMCPSINDSVYDLSGNGVDAFYDGGTGTVSDTDSGGTRAYNMSSTTTSRIELPTSINASFSSDSSVSIWFKYTGPIFNADPSAAFIGTSSTSGQWFHAGRLNNNGNQTGTYQSYADDGANNGLASTASVVSEEDGVWHHAVITRDYTSNESKVYVDGVLLGTDTFTSGTISTSHVHYIGYSQVGTYSYAGALTNSGESLYYDDIRVYSRVITAYEVAHLASSRGVQGNPFEGLGDEKLWLCPSLDDSADDLSSNGNHGTYNGGMATTADTGSGGSRAYNHDTVARGVRLPADLGISGTSMSISMWLYNTSNNVGSGVDAWLGAYNGANSDSNMMFYQFNDKLLMADKNTSPDTTINPSITTPSTNQWIHMAAVADGAAGEYRFYIDGVLEDTVSAGGSDMTVQTTIPWHVGGGGLYQSAIGMSDDIRAYGRALTSDEVAHLATSRGIQGTPFEGLGDEKLWLCPSIDDSADDLSGNQNHGAYIGDATTVDDTSNGGTRAYDFDGSGDGIDCPSTTLSGSSFSVSCWFNQDTLDTQDNLFGNYNYDLNQRTWYVAAGANPKFLTSGLNNSSSQNVSISSSQAVSANQWYHLVAIYDDTTNTMELFIDGVSVGTANQPNGLAPYVAPFTVGYSTVQYLNGSMDDVRAYDRVLTQAEINHLATSRGILGGPTPPPASGFYNPFSNKTFNPNYTRRIG